MDLMVILLGILLLVILGICIGQFVAIGEYKTKNERLCLRLDQSQEDLYSLQQRAVKNAIPPAVSASIPSGDNEKALDGLRTAVRMGFMAEDEAREMARTLGLGSFSMTPATPVGDDVCPECGEAFDVQDDYVCAKCREQLNA